MYEGLERNCGGAEWKLPVTFKSYMI